MKILGSLIFAIIFAIVFMMCLYKYWNLLKTFSFRFRALLFSLRIITITGLLLLLINPWFNVLQHKDVSPQIDVIFDHSESLKYHYEKGDVQSSQIKDKIETWGSASGMDLHFYRMGDKIRILENLEHYAKSEKIPYKKAHQKLKTELKK